MKVLDQSKSAEYENMMQEMDVIVVQESSKALKALSATKETIPESVKEISMSVGQVALDKMIELTEDMSRKELLDYLTEIALSAVVSAMNHNPLYKMKIMALSQE